MPQQDSSLARAITQRMLTVMRSIIASDPQVKNQEQFAKAIGIVKQALSRWKSGQANSTLENVAQVCHRFKVNPSYLIMGVGDVFLYSESKVNIEHRVAELQLSVSQLQMQMSKMKKPSSGLSKRKKLTHKTNITHARS
jgi:transcriptional regulator with XRE-family HTH domain